MLPAAALIVLAGLAAGCGPRHVAPVSVFVAYNTSKSFRDKLSAAATVGSLLESGLNVPGDRVSEFRFDANCRQLSTARRAQPPEQTMATLSAELSQACTAEGTADDILFRKIAEQAGASAPAAVVVFDDYACEGVDAAAHRSIRSCARRMAANPNFLLFVFGVDPRFRSSLDSDMAPLKGRMVAPPEGDFDPGAVADAVAALRQRASAGRKGASR
jgi:hypothetical protein